MVHVDKDICRGSSVYNDTLILVNKLDADLSDMSTGGKVLKGLNGVLLGEGKFLLDGQSKAPAGNKLDHFLQKLSRSDSHTSNNSSLGKRHASDIGHLLGLRKESDDGHVSSHLDGIDTFGDSPGTAVFKDIVDTLAVGDLHDLLGPLRVGLIVNGVVCAIGLLHEVELFIAGGSDDDSSTSGLSQDQTSDGDTTSS